MSHSNRTKLRCVPYGNKINPLLCAEALYEMFFGSSYSWDHMNAAIIATKRQSDLEYAADVAEETVAEYMHRTGQWPMSKGA